MQIEENDLRPFIHAGSVLVNRQKCLILSQRDEGGDTPFADSQMRFIRKYLYRFLGSGNLKYLWQFLKPSEHSLTLSLPSPPLPILTTGLIPFGAIERTEAAIHYIAKIIRQFDLVGIVELRHNIKGLPMVLEVLIPT